MNTTENITFFKSVPLFFVIVCLLVLTLSSSLVYGYQYNRENAVVKAVREISPAVVNISSETEVVRRSNPFFGFGNDSLFDSFFKDFFYPGFERKYKKTSLGSGVIIDGDRGFILTNAHVIAHSASITVILPDKREFKAQTIGTDPESDLAVLKIETPERLPSVGMGKSDDLMIGETVIAIGNPFGFSNTVTTGVISAINRSVKAGEKWFHDFIQTDASINPGNSGGPLLNINGELIGINTAIYQNAQGIGFAIPINKAKRIVNDLIQYGEVVSAWLGLYVQDISSELSSYMNMAKKAGVIVTRVEKDSPAHRAGIRDGDIVLSIGKRDVYSADEFRSITRGFTAGDVIDLTVYRQDGRRQFSIRTIEYPLEKAEQLADELMGIRVENLHLKNRHKYDLHQKNGAVITEIDPRSYLARIGVNVGDIILQIDGDTIEDTGDFKKAIIKYRKKASVVVLVQRGFKKYYITVYL
jgi:Do/DeqQ family serine protease